MRKQLLSTALITSTLMLTGCNPEADQSRICEVSDMGFDKVSQACTEGQKIGYLPDYFGNQQNPVIFAALYCDHRFEIAMTEGGVSCIYKPVNPDELDLN